MNCQANANCTAGSIAVAGLTPSNDGKVSYAFARETRQSRIAAASAGTEREVYGVIAVLIADACVGQAGQDAREARHGRPMNEVHPLTIIILQLNTCKLKKKVAQSVS